MNYKFRPSWEKAIIVGIPGTATYRIQRKVGSKKVNMQKLKPRHCGDGNEPPNQDPEEPGRGTKGRRIPEKNKTEDKNLNEEARDDNATPGVLQQKEMQVQEETEEQGQTESEQEEQEENVELDLAEQEDDKSEEELSEEEEEAKKNTKRYNLRKRKGRTVYVSALKVFQLDNLRDTDDVIEAIKRGYEVSIGEVFLKEAEAGQCTKAERKRQSTD
jgi:glycerophosphoryl diester phosphodiesterase